VSLRISWSALRTHEECKQRSALYRGHKRGALTDQRMFLPGNITDRVVRDFLLMENPMDNLGIMPSMVEEHLEKTLTRVEEEGGIISWKSREDRRQIIHECILAVTRIEKALVERVIPFSYTPAYRFEVPMRMPHPRGGTEVIHLVGEMDITGFRGEEDFFVYDVKHTKNDEYWRKTAAQLTFYALVVEAENGVRPKEVGLFQPLCTEQVKIIEVRDDWRQQMLQRIMSMCNDIWNNDETPRTDYSKCGWCDVKHACVKFRPVMVNGKKMMEL